MDTVGEYTKPKKNGELKTLEWTLDFTYFAALEWICEMIFFGF